MIPPNLPPKLDQLFCQQATMFDPQEFEKSSLHSLKVLSQENALARIIEEYSTLKYSKFNYIEGSLGLSATHQQLADKIYHAPSLYIG